MLATFVLTLLLAGPSWAGQTDDTGGGDSGTDGGTSDGGTVDGGTVDGGTVDGGTEDGGTVDGGTVDGGTEDGGTEDGGTSDDTGEAWVEGGDKLSERAGEQGGFGCEGSSATLLFVGLSVGLLGAGRRRR